MKPLRIIALCVLVAGPLGAAQSDDPDWPCVQRRVDSLSLGVMWPHPVPEEAGRLAPEHRALAEAMALRRLSIDEVARLVDEFAATHPDVDVDGYGLIFAEAFNRMDRRRTILIRGITRYARGQAQLSEEIDTLREEMAALEAASEPDFDRMDQVEAELDWRERVFDERNAALTYVCETPVLLERRIFEVAQLLMNRID